MKMVYFVIFCILGQGTVLAAEPVPIKHQSASFLQTFLLSQPVFLSNGQKQTDLKWLGRERDLDQVYHARFKQLFLGVPVWGGDVVTHVKPDSSSTANGLLYKGLETDLKSLPLYLQKKEQSERALNYAIRLYQQEVGREVKPTQSHITLMFNRHRFCC